MTHRRNLPADACTNYFNQIERGIGKRGSSFTDIDGVSHDGDTDRFLFREFKREGEPLPEGQRRTLMALAKLPGVTVWFLRVLDDGRIRFYTPGSAVETLEVGAYQRRLIAWWYPPAPSACKHRPEYQQNGRCWICASMGKVDNRVTEA